MQLHSICKRYDPQDSLVTNCWFMTSSRYNHLSRFSDDVVICRVSRDWHSDVVATSDGKLQSRGYGQSLQVIDVARPCVRHAHCLMLVILRHDVKSALLFSERTDAEWLDALHRRFRIRGWRAEKSVTGTLMQWETRSLYHNRKLYRRTRDCRS